MKFFVDADRIVNVFPKPGEPTHYLTNKIDTDKIDIDGDIEWMVNRFKVTTQLEPVLTSLYEDAVSIAQYGKRFEKETTELYWQSTIDTYAQNYVNERKDAKSYGEIIVNRNYPIEKLKPGDTIKVRNYPHDLSNLQIEKVNYTNSRATIYLGRYVSFGNKLLEIAK